MDNITIILAYIKRDINFHNTSVPPAPETAGLLVLTSDNDECFFLNTYISNSSIVFYFHLSFVFLL